MQLNEEINNLLNRIKESSAKSRNNQSLLNLLLKEICSFTGWEYGEAWLPDAEQKQMKFAAAWSINKKRFADFEKFSSICKFAEGVGLVGKTWKQKHALNDDHLSIKSDFLRYEIGRKCGFVNGKSFFTFTNNNIPLIFAFFSTQIKPDDEKFFQHVNEILQHTGKLITHNSD